MKTTRRTEIRLETDQTLVIKSRRQNVPGWCTECGANQMATALEAATVLGVSSRAIYRGVEAGELHFAESPDGALFICLNSLIGRQ